jgi:GT2 family glycosyltransferase
MNEAENIKILVLVVLYKTIPSHSETLNSLISQYLGGSIQLVIWDNSPERMPQDEEDILRNKIAFEYIHQSSNTPLSKLYNEVATNFNFQYILLLDQDSHIPNNYMATLKTSIHSHPNIELFLPIVKNKEVIVSPGHFQMFKGKHWSSVKYGVLKSQNTLAITSGMCISKRYFNDYNYRFDERLNLYGIDTKFMLDFSKNVDELYVLNLPFKHNSALWSNSSADELIPRFRNLRNAWKIILDDRPLPHFLSKLHNVYVSIKLAIKFKDIRFLY